MTKEDKQIIDRAVKEEWRIGDRTRLKRLLEKNLTLYRENVELEKKLEQTEKDLADYQFNYPTIKELTEGTCFAHLKSLEKENAELKERVEKAEDLIEDMYDRIPASHSDYYKDVTERARQFLWGIKK